MQTIIFDLRSSGQEAKIFDISEDNSQIFLWHDYENKPGWHNEFYRHKQKKNSIYDAQSYFIISMFLHD